MWVIKLCIIIFNYVFQSCEYVLLLLFFIYLARSNSVKLLETSGNVWCTWFFWFGLQTPTVGKRFASNE